MAQMRENVAMPPKNNPSDDEEAAAFARRVALALARVRGPDGRPVPATVLESEFGLGQGTLGRAAAGTRKAHTRAVLVRMINALRVDAGWLLTGAAGVSDDQMPDLFPSRASVVAAAQAAGVSPAAVAARAEQSHEEDPGTDHWYERLAYHRDKIDALTKPQK